MTLTYMQLRHKRVTVSIELELDKEACSITLERMIDIYSERQKQQKKIKGKELKYKISHDSLISANHKAELAAPSQDMNYLQSKLLTAINEKFNVIESSMKMEEYIKNKDHEGMMNLICEELNLKLNWKEDEEWS